MLNVLFKIITLTPVIMQTHPRKKNWSNWLLSNRVFQSKHRVIIFYFSWQTLRNTIHCHFHLLCSHLLNCAIIIYLQVRDKVSSKKKMWISFIAVSNSNSCVHAKNAHRPKSFLLVLMWSFRMGKWVSICVTKIGFKKDTPKIIIINRRAKHC